MGRVFFGGHLCRTAFVSVSLVLMVLVFAGCEVEKTRSLTSDAPEGIVQARVDEDGVPHVVLAMAPKKPGGEAPDLSALQEVNLFDRTQIPSANSPSPTEVRGRVTSRPKSGGLGVLLFSAAERPLQDLSLRATLGSLETQTGVVNWPGETANDLVCYSSSEFVAFDHYINFDNTPNGIQKITFSHGPYAGSAEIYQQGTGLWAGINGASAKFVGAIPANSRFVRLGILLPLYCGVISKGIDDPLLSELVGTWTLNAEPQFSDRAIGYDGPLHPNAPGGGEGVGATPFDFTLKALIVEGVKASYRPDVVDQATGDPYSAGATFTANAKFINSADANALDTSSTRFESGPFGHETMSYKAEIFADGGQVVRTIYGSTTIPTGSGTTITVDWDGTTNAGNPASGDTVYGDTVYGVSITAMLERLGDRLPGDTIGDIFNVAPGVGPEGVSPAFDGNEGFTITPNPYIPYTDEEINGYGTDENDDEYWLDTDGDGEPNFPDHDNDGEEDFSPGDGPPPIQITGDLGKRGYTTEWTLAVFKDNEAGEREEVFTGDLNEYSGPPPWTGDETIDLEWVPPNDLDVPELFFELTLTRCRATQVNVQIFGRDAGDGVQCAPPVVQEKTLALGNPKTISLTLRHSDGKVIAKSGTGRNNQSVGLKNINLDTDFLKIEAQGDGIPAEITTLNVEVRSRPTLYPGVALTLTRSNSEAPFTGNFSPSVLFRDNGANEKPSFSSIDWSVGLKPQGDSLSFMSNILLRDGDIGGRSFVEVKDRKILSKDRVMARFANPANVLMLSGHGSYTGFTNTGTVNIILASRTQAKPANAFHSENWRSIRTLIAAGCVACNLNDYALNSKAHIDENEVGKDYFERIPASSPARTLKALIHPEGIILGYQSGAPDSPADIPPISRFFEKMGPNWISEDTTTSLLWVRAHAEVDFLDNASAMDNQAYYYISYKEILDPPRLTLVGKRQKITHTKRWIRRIARSEWDKPLRSEHEMDFLDKLPNINIDVLPVGGA